MKMSGTRQLDASQNEVWAKLNDIDVLKRCIPGCESLEQSGEHDLKAVVALKIGPIAARFNGDVKLSDMSPPHGYRISGKGSGGAVGGASGGATVKLEPRDGGTLLAYDVDANVTGKIAQLGSRLIDATAARLADEFFTRFANEVAPPAAQAASGDAAAAGGAAHSGAPKRAGGLLGLPTWAWAVAAAMIAAALFFWSRSAAA